MDRRPELRIHGRRRGGDRRGVGRVVSPADAHVPRRRLRGSRGVERRTRAHPTEAEAAEGRTGGWTEGTHGVGIPPSARGCEDTRRQGRRLLERSGHGCKFRQRRDLGAAAAAARDASRAHRRRLHEHRLDPGAPTMEPDASGDGDTRGDGPRHRMRVGAHRDRRAAHSDTGAAHVEGRRGDKQEGDGRVLVGARGVFSGLRGDCDDRDWGQAGRGARAAHRAVRRDRNGDGREDLASREQGGAAGGDDGAAARRRGAHDLQGGDGLMVAM